MFVLSMLHSVMTFSGNIFESESDDWLLDPRFMLCFCVSFVKRNLYFLHGCCSRFEENDSFSHFKIILSCSMIKFLCSIFSLLRFIEKTKIPLTL